MSLALLGLLCAPSAQAQQYPGGYPGGSGSGSGGSGSGSGGYPTGGGSWSVTDQTGNPIPANNSGYPLRGPMTGSYTLSQAYQDVLAAAQQPNPPVGYAFAPSPNSYQNWLFTGGSTPPGGGYNPYAVWTTVNAQNFAGTPGGGQTGWLGMPYNEAINGNVTANTGGTLWAVFQWYDPYPPSYYAYTHSTPPTPPQYIDILLQTTVSASADPQSGGLSSSATATDSTYNETASAPGGNPLVTGKHLLRVGVDPSTHKAQVSLGGTTTATASNSVPYGVMGNYPGTTSGGYYQMTNGPMNIGSGASVSATAALDSRDVAIASSLEPTWHKDPTTGNPTQNVRAASGFMVADTVAPDASTTLIIRYSPLYNGSSWGSNSQYHWHSNDYSPDASGTFNSFLSPNVSSPTVNYINPPTTPGSNDYITLTLTDSTDGAIASNNYSVLFHDYYEQWTRLTRTPHPVSYTNPGGSSEWTRLVSVDSPGSTAQTSHLNQAYSDSITETGTIGTQGSLTAPGVAALQRNENITNGETVTGTLTTSYDFPGMAYERISYYVAKTYEERTGTTDAYAGNGFQGTQVWHAVFATNPMLLTTTYTIDFQYPQP